MPDIRSFDSFEEMQEFIAENERKANEGILPTQRAITFGDKVVSYDFEQNLIIFGRIYTEKEWMDGEFDPEWKDYGYPSEEEYRKELHNQMMEPYDRGYRFGWWVSAPYAEQPDIGSKHIVTLWPISQEVWDFAESHGWLITQEMWEEIESQSYNEAKEHGLV